MGFRSARTKVCSGDTELRRKNLNFLVGNVYTDDAVSAAWSTWKWGKGYVLKLKNSWGKECKFTLQASLFHIASWSYRFSGLYIILMHLVMTIHMNFNNQIKKSMPEEKLFKSFLKQYWPYLIILTSNFFTYSFSNIFYFDLYGIFTLLSAAFQYMQSSVILSHQRLFVTPISPFRCTQWQCNPMAGICSALRTTVLGLDWN